MPETFQSLAVLVLALLPGALYVWAFERQAGAWGIRLSDRLFRFVGFSALMHALLAPVTFRLWDEFLRSGRLSSGMAPLLLWLLPLAYVGVPILLGTIVGLGTRDTVTSAMGALLHRPEPRTAGLGSSVRWATGGLDPIASEERFLARWRVWNYG